MNIILMAYVQATVLCRIVTKLWGSQMRNHMRAFSSRPEQKALRQEVSMAEYIRLGEEQVRRSLFADFHRRQVVDEVLRRVDGEWAVRHDPFIDEWSGEDYEFLIECLRRTVRTGGFVCGAFVDGVLKGFASVEAAPVGSRGQYMDLSCLHVSSEMRGCGIGTNLFRLAAGWAGQKGGQKLYISSHSAVETQAFYARMGCVDALEPIQEHVEAEPYDRQLEYEM